MEEMGDSEITGHENTAPVYLLLPTCIESKNDIFLEILRNVVQRTARTKLDNNFLYNALKTGMKAETFAINSDDIVGHWKELKSKSEQVRQSKMLGYWAIQNFPSLGKKLFGESWQVPQRKCVDVVGQGSMKPDEIDAVIFRKLKIRLVELSLSESTFSRFKHFVKVPIDIGKFNDVHITQKIKCFDIETEYLQNCWDALKRGKFSMNDSINVNIEVSFPLTKFVWC